MSKSPVHKKLAHYVLLLAIVSLPFSIALQSISGILLVLSGLYTGYHNKWRYGNVHPAFYFLIPLILWLLLTTLWSSDPGVILALKFKGFFFFALFALFHADLLKEKWKQYILVFIYAVITATIICMLIGLLGEHQLISLTQKTTLLRPYEKTIDAQVFGAYSPFIDRLHFSYLMGAAAIFALAMAYYGHSRYIRMIFPVLLLISGIFYIGARGGQLAIGFTAFLGASYLAGKWMNKYTRLGYWISTATMIIVIAILSYGAFRFVPVISKRWHQAKWELEQYTSGQAKPEQLYYFTSVRRLLSWKYNVELILKHPLAGVGVGDYDREMQFLYDRDQVPVPVHRQQQFLYFWVVGGLPAFLLFVLAMYAIFRIKQGDKPRLIALSIAFFYCFIFLLDTPLNYKVGNMSLGFILIVLHHFTKRAKEDGRQIDA